MKKRILIVSDSLRIGGIQKSLIHLLNNINHKKYDVSLFLFNDQNTEGINEKVTIIKSNYILRTLALTSKEAKKKSKIQFLIRTLFRILCRIFTSNFIYSILYFFLKNQKNFDIAISYSNNVDNKSLYYGYNKYVLKKVSAKTKISWIHIDYATKNYQSWELKEYSKFDKLILVSNSCKNNFDKLYPSLSNKTFVVYNFLSHDSIIEKSEEFSPNFDKNKINIVSIGRIEDNKNFFAQVRIIKNLVIKGINLNLYIIGDGIDKQVLQEKIKEEKLDKNIKLLGNKKNVYPYIKNATFLISTSKSESFGLTIAEALVLKTPVISLNYPALKEIIYNKNGIICNNETDMEEKLYYYIKNNKEYYKLKENTKYLIANEFIKQQFDSAIN